MSCPDFEDLISGAAGDHAVRCEHCRALLDAVAEVDATLESALSGIPAPPGMAAAARAQIERERILRAPSLVPEVLDFIGWAAVLALAAVLLPRFIPLIDAAIARLS